eukprot:scaffold85364_cov48-Phaeocystis_antarctica.AAC.2
MRSVQMMRPKGPSPRERGMRRSSSRAIITCRRGGNMQAWRVHGMRHSSVRAMHTMGVVKRRYAHTNPNPNPRPNLNPNPNAPWIA